MKEISLSEHQAKIVFAGLTALTVISTIATITLDSFVPLLIPPAVLFAWFVLFDFSKVYYCMIFFIPFTTEFAFPGGLAMDLPAEPMVILLTGVLIFYLIYRGFNPAFIKHPIIQVLFIHVLWIGITVVFAPKMLIGIKWFMAKLWFVGTFVFITAIVLKRLDDFKTFFWVIIIPSVISILIIIQRHAQFAFDFEKINAACSIYFRNHVNYAAFVSLLIPFIWLAGTWYKKGAIGRHLITLLKIIFLVATYLAYARGAWLALIAAVGFYYILRLRLLWLATIGIVAFFLFLGVHLGTDKQFMNYAPNFEKAVSHGNLTDHLKATLKNQDVSTAERFYRWVSGVRMSTEHPVTGFGPGAFYHYYKHYTVYTFRTYVSDNPEKSGVHNYFLMTLIEQGFPGLIIFILFTIIIFSEGSKTYHRAKDKNQKNFIAAILCSLVVIYVQLMLSDLIEALQVGSFFLINIALLVNVSLSQAQKSLATGFSEKPAGQQRNII